MKWITFLAALMLTACSLNDPDDIAYRQVMVPTSPAKANFWGDSPSIDVTTTTIGYP